MARDVVVLIHGIWMNGLEMRLLGWHLRRCGFECRYFRYASLRETPHQNALRLQTCLEQIPATRVHLVAHSLGGIVLAHLLSAAPPSRPGRVVMLGAPLQGSAVARYLSGRRLLRWFLGQSVVQGLLGDVPVWQDERQVGLLAGSRGFGIGQLLAPGKLEKPNDGTVAVSETRSPLVNEHRSVPYSHMSMLFSSQVAGQVCHYLRYGCFSDS